MPQFNRPEHDDFWLLSQIIIDNDNAMETGTVLMEDKLAQVVDPDSVTYMARQRALRVVGPYATTREQAKIAAIWLDAFMAGAAFQAKKNEQASE